MPAGTQPPVPPARRIPPMKTTILLKTSAHMPIPRCALLPLCENNGMLTGHRLTGFALGIAFLFVSFSGARGVEVVSQQIELNSTAQVIFSNGGLGSLDQASRNNQGLGDRSLQSSTFAEFNDVEVTSEASIEVRRTNSASADTFQIESRLAMHSEDFLSVVSTQMNTRAVANVVLTLQVRLETPMRYDIEKSGHFNLPGSGAVLITTQNG